jgi:hypothetical protein
LRAFAFSPFGCSEIGATEQGFQRQGEIVSIGEPPFGSEIRQEFQQVLGLQGTSNTEDSDLHQFQLHSGVQDMNDTESQDTFDPALISDPPLRLDPDRDPFQTIFSAWGEIGWMGFLDEVNAPSIIKAAISGPNQIQSSISSSLGSYTTLNPQSSLILMNTGAVVTGDLRTRPSRRLISGPWAGARMMLNDS